MATEKQQNLQDVFLNHVRKNKVPVTVFLINGVKLQGVISSFDNFCLLLRRDGHVQLVYKHAVSTVMPSAAVRLYEPAAGRAGAAAGLIGHVAHPEQRRRRRRRQGGAWVVSPFEPGGRRRCCAPSAGRLAEDGRLARAIDLEVVRAELVPLRRRVPATLLGSGKVKEFGLALEAEPVELVVLDGACRRCSSATSSGPGRPRSSTAPG